MSLNLVLAFQMQHNLPKELAKEIMPQNQMQISQKTQNPIQWRNTHPKSKSPAKPNAAELCSGFSKQGPMQQNQMQNPQVDDGLSSSFGVTYRPREESIAAANPSFTDGVATQDIHIDPLTSLAL